MQNIINELKTLEELIMRCMKCGNCQSVCPLYQKDLTEQSVARSKIALIESIYEGRLKDAEKILPYIDYCILCGRCKGNCPSGVKVDEIFLRAKDIIRKIKKMKGWQRVVLNIAMQRPHLLARLAPLMHIGLKYSAKKIKEDIFKPLIGDFSKRNVVSIKPIPFTEKAKGLHTTTCEKMKVLFYPGCAVNYLFPSVGDAVIGVLNHLGISVYVPEINTCCGIPAASMGDLELYKKMVHSNHDYFEAQEVQYVITCCPTCEYGLKDIGMRIAGRKSLKKIVDILIFVKDFTDINVKAKVDKRISLHMPCHYDSSRANLPRTFINEHIEGEFIPLQNQDCCGFGGTFNLKFYDKSKGLSISKAEEVKAKGIETLLAPCPGCMMQLTDALTSEGCNIVVSHPVELIYKEILMHVNPKLSLDN